MPPPHLAEFDVPVILIVFIVISAIKWLLERIKGKNDPELYEDSETLEDIYENFREEIQQRQTTVQQDPPGQTPPPIPQATPSVQQVQQVQHVQKHPEPAEVSHPIKLSAEQKAAAKRFQQLGTAIGSSKRKRRQGPQASVRTMLSNPESTKQAIILKEILGKPKSMQDA